MCLGHKGRHLKPSIEQALRRAKLHAQKGESAEAIEIYRGILASFPNNKRARKALAELEQAQPGPIDARLNNLAGLFQQGKLVEMLDGARALVKEAPNTPVLWNLIGIANCELEQFATSEDSFEKAISLAPEFSDAHFNLGIVLQAQGKFDRAANSYRRTLSLNSGHPGAHNNLGALLQAQGQVPSAIEHYRRALQLEPRFVDAHENLGIALHIEGRLDEAIESYRQVLSLAPHRVEILEKLGDIYRKQGKNAEATEYYRKALQIDSNRPDVFNGLGLTLQDTGRLNEAAESFRHALTLDPNHVNSHNNLGTVLRTLGQIDNAVDSYLCALRHDPDHADAYNNLGNAFQEQGRYREAENSYRSALKINPDFAETYHNLGNALQEQSRLDEAIENFEHALRIKPDYGAARADKLHQQALMCDWSYVAEFQRYADTLGIDGDAVAPFTMFSKEDDPYRQMRRSENWSRKISYLSPGPPLARPDKRPSKMRVGYFSADFHNHPTMHLMSGVFEKHDKSRFEIYVYSCGPIKEGALRERLKEQADCFSDIHGVSDFDAVELALQHELDIAVDLAGHTANSRISLFAARLAPVQASYLVFAGTTGAEFIDYLVADEILIPEELRDAYTESIVYLPDSYQPNDNTRSISGTSSTRLEFDLPEDAFVLCCFNNNNKIGPREFDIWMRLLGQVDGSVLWLLRSNQFVEDNLRREAAVRGIDGSRLIFAEKLPQAEHLERHRHADLFLDTFNFNAHTTASDALWAGLPILTKQGKQFAARVAASLLHAVGLPELVTDSEEAYEAMALVLATDRGKLASIKSKLAENRTTQPLFDTDLYTRSLEAAYEKIYDRYFEGSRPTTIWVRDTKNPAK